MSNQEDRFGMSFSSAAAKPTGLDLDLRAQTLTINWADGEKSIYPAAFLRKHCPCASCRTDREKQSRTLLPILSAGAGGELRLTGGQIVGNYALQIEWSDGHNTGIFDFRMLRALAAELLR